MKGLSVFLMLLALCCGNLALCAALLAAGAWCAWRGGLFEAY